MKTFLLDTSALLTLRDNEPGADEVAALLRQAQRGEVHCHGCFISLMEVFYRVWKDEEESAGRLAYQQCQSLPMTWIHETPALLEKAVVPLSFRDQSRANWGTTFPGGVALASKEAIPGMTRVHGLSTGDR